VSARFVALALFSKILFISSSPAIAFAIFSTAGGPYSRWLSAETVISMQISGPA
jgi:hypothetical protein